MIRIRPQTPRVNLLERKRIQQPSHNNKGNNDVDDDYDYEKRNG